MAQAKAKRSSRTKKSSEAERIEREYRRLGLAIGDVQAFRLYLATYNDPRRRDELIDRLAAESERQKLEVTRLDVSDCDPEVSLVRVLREHVEQSTIPPGWQQAVMVVGLEQLLDYGDTREGLAVLETANLQRDLFTSAAPVPVVFWLSPLASSAFPKAAPDLWHWRGASFDLTGHTDSRADLLRDMIKIPREQLLESTDPRVGERAAMLEELIAELDRSGPPKSGHEARERASLLFQLGGAYIQLDRFSEALPVVQRGLKVLREAGVGLHGKALLLLAQLYDGLGEPQQAFEQYQQALEIAHRTGDRETELQARDGQGRLLGAQGKPQKAIERYEQALEIAREIDNREGKLRILSGLGDANHDLGELRRAIDHYEQALEIAREIGDIAVEARTLYGLASAQIQLGEGLNVVRHCQKTLETARKIGDRRAESRTLSVLGMALSAAGEVQSAIEYYQQALLIAHEIGDRGAEESALFGLGLASDALGEPLRAIEYYQRAVKTAREIGSRGTEAVLSVLLGSAYRKLGEPQRAIEVVRQALEIAQGTGADHIRELVRTCLPELDLDHLEK
jgi:tetratricopeptide (TPR) repeat protein